MKKLNISLTVLLYLCTLLFAWTASASHPLVRQPNTSLNLPQNPQAPQVSYSIAEAMGGLVFDKPINFALEPGETNRLFVVERMGRIAVITNLAIPTRTVFMDITNKVYADYEFGFVEGLSSLAFHPGYATNRMFYITYTFRTNEAGVWKNYNRLSRFQRHATDPNRGLSTSELVLINQWDQGDGHNMNDLHFGPDGYLYCSIGDEGDGRTGGDEFNNAQRIDKDFFSAILRIDVDKRPGNLTPNSHPAATTNYAIPADNPFIGATNFNGSPVNPSAVRTEFYAVGFRNVWRMSFDPLAGYLFAGDVGAYEREEINAVVKGGNYGWAFREGTRSGPKGAAPAGANLISPIAEIYHGYATNQGNAIIGGRVYRGNRLSELHGAYVFSDYVSGHIWMLRYDGSAATPFTRIASKAEIGAFGVDPRNGDLLIADHYGGHILKLDYSSVSGGNLPLTLADTGAFSNVSTLTPQNGIVPYDVNVSFWSDNAKKRRWFSLPDTNLRFTFQREGNWSFPATTVWIKHFDLELTNGVPSSSRRIETRFLVKNSGGVYGITYRWGDSTTNAWLVPEGGLQEQFVINDNGTLRTQVWKYPSRSECLACHTPAGGLALGFNTAQLNRDFAYPSVANQINALDLAGYLNQSVTNISLLRALAPATNAAVSKEYRVRSYLSANCAQCHQPGANPRSYWDARINTPTSQAGLINGPLFNDAGNPANRVVKPGSTNQSMLLSRLQSQGALHMPPLGSTLLNKEAISLLSDWITVDLANYRTFAEWQLLHFGSTNSSAAAASADPDGDGDSNYLEYLFAYNPLSQDEHVRIDIQKHGDTAHLSLLQRANRGLELQAATNLTPPISWAPLNLPANQLQFPALDRIHNVSDTISNAFKVYRLRVLEP